MAREIRITIDDDEVFERLKRRKSDLDLSWEEALRRGLADEEFHGPAPPGRGPSGPRRHGPGRHERGRRGPGGRGHGWDREEFEPSFDVGSPLDDDFGERLRRDIERSVEEAMSAADEALRGVGAGLGVDLDEELDRIEDAEDAVLAFPFLDEESARVPLRVTLETGGEGLDVEVVAVRTGRSVADLNRFPDGARARITEALARDERASLELQDGAESYAVTPSLSWGRSDDGTPSVTDVDVQAVHFE